MKSFKTLAASIALGACLSVPAQAADPVKVGFVLPYSSVFASIGKEIDQAFELGLEHFGSEVAGRKIEIVREDTEVKPDVGLAKAKKLVFQDKADVLVGPVSSGVLGALRDFVHGAKVPLVVANAGNDDLSAERCSPWVIRTSFSNRQIVRPMGPWMYSKGYRKVFLMAPDYAAGHQMMNHFKDGFTEAGGTIVGEEYPPLRDTKDYGPYIAKVKAAKPDALFVFFAGGGAIQFVKQYDAFGAAAEVPLTGAGWLTSALYIKAQGDAANGIISSLNYVPTIDNPANKKFQDGYRAKFGKTASEFAVQGYDAARVIVEGLRAVNGDTSDKQAFMDAMRKVTFDGPRGQFKFDQKNGNIIQNIYISKNEKQGENIVPVVIDVVENYTDPSDACKM